MTQIKTYNLKDLRKAIIATIKQGVASKASSGLCLYNMKACGTTLHCVIGHMIKDDVHAQGVIYSIPVGSPSGIRTIVNKGAFEVDSDELIEIMGTAQYIHDSIDPDYWLVEFNQLLTEEGLTQITQLEVDNV